MTQTGAKEYGGGGWVGVGTPQANPTVEMEMRRLLPADVEPLTTRLRSQAETSDGRLVDYIERLPDALAAFDVLPLGGFGFACTGSSYLIGATREQAIAAEAEQTFGYPIITAAAAVSGALAALGAARIALLAPYPAHLIDAGVAYWEAAGVTVAAVRRIEIASNDTRSIYSLGSADAIAAMRDFDPANADVILLSGTGMPTLRALGPAASQFGRPALSSNSCLAWALLRSVGRPDAPTDVTADRTAADS